MIRETLQTLLSNMYVRYIISGGSAAATLLGLLFVLHDLFDLPVVLSSSIAFIFAFIVSFTLQKFWTFRDATLEKAHFQLASFLTTALINLGIDAASMHVLVNIFGVWYLFAQVLTAGSIAIWSFFIYRHLIFKEPSA